MTFENFMKDSWSRHGSNPQQVADQFEGGFALVEKNEQIPAFAQLITHVTGEHLGHWQKGVDLLKKLSRLSCFVAGTETEAALRRSLAILELADGNESALKSLSASDAIRALVTAAASLAAQNQTERAAKLYRQGLQMVESGLQPSDPANRTLAMTGNSLACTLEEKSNRTTDETQLMLLAAGTARRFWEVAGSWLEVERAEYRLAMSFLKAGDLSTARTHAQKCVAICEQNQAADVERFFGYEVIARVEKASGDATAFQAALTRAQELFAGLSADDQAWCQPSLHALLGSKSV